MTAALVPLDTGDDRLIDLWVFGKAEQTAEAYRRDARQFLAYAGKPLSAVTLSDLQGYALSLSAAGLSETSQRRKLASVKSLLSYGQRVGLIPVNVGAVIKLQRPRQRINERILTEAEVQRLFVLAGDDRAVAVLRLLYYTGCRVSELAALRWPDIAETDDRYLVTVTGKGNKERVIAVRRDKVSSALAVLRALHAPTVTGWSRVTIWRVVKDAAERAGLTIDDDGQPRGVSPHWLRHSCATHAVARDMPLVELSRQFGHASIETTVSFYVHSRPGIGAADYLP